MARPTLLNSVKFRLLVSALRQPRPHVLGYLEMFWGTAHETGIPVFRSAVEIEAAAEWVGEPGVSFAALRDLGWIDPVQGDRWEIHDYYVHAPSAVVRKTERQARGKTISDARRRAANARWAKQTAPPGVDANGMQTDASENHLHQPHANGMQTDASGSTPYSLHPTLLNTSPPKGGVERGNKTPLMSFGRVTRANCPRRTPSGPGPN